MHEQVLRDYFASLLTAERLTQDLAGAVVRMSSQSSSRRIIDMDEDFEVRTEHLVRLCEDVIVGSVKPESLEVIGFCLIASDRFHWDTDTQDGDRVGETLYDWSVPEINYQLTQATTKKFLHRLRTGEELFTDSDLTGRSA